MKEYGGTLSEIDYERLPPALRRKYFSSLERLRLAQDGAYPIYSSSLPREPQQPTTSSNASSFSARRSTRRPSTARTLDNCLLTSTPSTRNKLRKSSRAVPAVTSQQIADYASLPPVLQRKHFTREEQVLLASRVNHVLFDAADEVLYKHEHKSHTQPDPTELPSTDFAILDSEDENEDDMELSEADLKSLRWLDQEEELDLRLDDYHAAISETTQQTQTQTSPRRSSFRRGLLISNLDSSRRSSSTNSMGVQAWPLPAATPLHPSSSKLPRTVQASNTSGHRKNRASTSSLDPDATHYQDPTARMKLRVYLASPQKFDEAIEFGFPSMQEPGVRRQRPTTSPHTADQVKSDDDLPSLSDCDDHDIENPDTPRTPEVSAFSTTFRKSKDNSLDRTIVKPRIIRDFTDPYVHALSANREMTLHMTLTRPDLRSHDEKMSATHVNARPLEQVPLQFSDSTTVFWDSLPEEESKVRRLFRRLKLRS